jgi:hypothetical protein
LDDAWPAHGDGRAHDGAPVSLDPGRPLAHDGSSHSDHAVRASHSGEGLGGSDGGCGLPDVPTPAELGGLLDGLVSDFRQGASVLAWHLAEPAKATAAAGGEGWHFPSADAGLAMGLMIGAGAGSGGGSGEALPASLDLHELLGGGGRALLDGLDLEVALQRALGSTGSARGVEQDSALHGLPDAHHFGAGDATAACAPAPSPSPGASAEPRHAGGGHGPGGEDQHVLLSLELGGGSGCAGASPLAALLEPQRHGSEGC